MRTQNDPKTDKARQDRLYRIADRRGFKLTKSRTRDKLAPDFGLFLLYDERVDLLSSPDGSFTLTAEDVEKMMSDSIETRRERAKGIKAMRLVTADQERKNELEREARSPDRPRFGVH